MINNLLRDNKEQLYCCWDVESCSLNLADINNKPWQIGLLICQGNDILEKYNFNIKWENLKLSDGAAIITKFNRQKHDSLAKNPKEVLDFFEKYLYNPKYIKLFTNGFGFDIYLHSIWRKSLGLKDDWSYLNDCIDTSALYKMVKLGVTELKREDFKKQMFKFIDYVEKGLKSSISASCKELEIPYDSTRHHEDATFDCEMTFAIWNKIKFRIDI